VLTETKQSSMKNRALIYTYKTPE